MEKITEREENSTHPNSFNQKDKNNISKYRPTDNKLSVIW